MFTARLCFGSIAYYGILFTTGVRHHRLHDPHLTTLMRMRFFDTLLAEDNRLNVLELPSLRRPSLAM